MSADLITQVPDRAKHYRHVSLTAGTRLHLIPARGRAHGSLHIELVQLGLQGFLVGELGLIFSDQRGRECSTEGVFDYLVVLAGAEQNSYGRLFMALAHIPVQRFEIKGQLAEVLRLESADL